MRKVIVIASILLFSCGGRYHVKQEGAVRVEIIYDFLDQLKEVCTDSFLIEDFETKELYNQAIANCVLETLQLLDLSWLTEEL